MNKFSLQELNRFQLQQVIQQESVRILNEYSD